MTKEQFRQVEALMLARMGRPAEAFAGYGTLLAQAANADADRPGTKMDVAADGAGRSTIMVVGEGAHAGTAGSSVTEEVPKDEDPEHDAGHVYRVLWNALRIAKTEPAANRDVVIISALLHDIGRPQAVQQPGLSHAEAGAHLAREGLLRLGWDVDTVMHVGDCVATHSYKKGVPPQSLEAQVLFDADKLDLSGAVGVARAMLFGAQIDEPLYLLDGVGMPTPGKAEEGPSLRREYHRKLSGLAGRFFTAEGKRLAVKRQKVMDAYFEAMEEEIDKGYRKGMRLLAKALVDEGMV